MINKKKYPLILLKSIEKMHQDVRKIVDENNELISYINKSEFEINLRDKADNSDFTFSITKPKYEKGKVEFYVTYNPRNGQSLDAYRFYSELKNVLNHLNIWINLLKEYENVNISPEEKILNEYEKEFYADFEILDDDADVNPFDLKRQLILHKFLDHTIEILEKDDNDNEDLIQDTKELRENLPRLTKKETVKKISRLFAKIRQKSLVLLKEILDVAKKEIYKKAISGGFKMIGEFIDLMV